MEKLAEWREDKNYGFMDMKKMIQIKKYQEGGSGHLYGMLLGV